MTTWILQAHFESLADLIPYVGDRSSAARIAANLDGLVIAEKESIALVEDVLANPPSAEAVAAATLLTFEMKAASFYSSIFRQLVEGGPEIRNAVRLAMRLSNVRPVIEMMLRMVGENELPVNITILDVLTFHRVSVSIDLQRLSQVEDSESRCLLLGCLGRTRNWNGVAHFAEDPDPLVRKAYWKAMADSGHPQILSLCRQRCVSNHPCHTAIRFLGGIGSKDDFGLLRRLLTIESTAVPAVEALGILGGTEVVPDIIAALANPATAQIAATALERVSGRGVPRAAPPPPPDHLSEDERDFWFHPGIPKSEVAGLWWNENRFAFETQKRYQAGHCVSDDPIGPVFDELPDNVRIDIYRRERALHPQSTPDWELETWPKYQRNPGWASQRQR